MIEITKSIARRWSMVGQRAAFGLAAVELAKENKNLMTLTADVSNSAGLDRMRRLYPEQYLDIGIAEQNMMGIAAGLASEGYDIVTATFAPFQSMRCLEQIRVNLGYMESKVVMVGLASGLVLGTLGNTHCCIEDIGVLRSIPNIAIISPADCGEAAKALEAAINYPKSVYIRLMDGGNCPIIYSSDYEFTIGKSVTLREAKKESAHIITIFASGTMVNESLKAAELLEEKGISAEVINMHTIKPIDADAVKAACKKAERIVTVEEHTIIGGLGSAVAEVKAGIEGAPPLLMLGLPDAYGHGGEYKDLMNQYGLTEDGITERIVKAGRYV